MRALLKSRLNTIALAFVILNSPAVYSANACYELLAPSTNSEMAKLEEEWSFLPGEVKAQIPSIDIEQFKIEKVEYGTQADSDLVYPDEHFMDITGHQSTVLYPGSGFDLSSGFRMFPNATTIIGFDNHPFIDHTERFFIPGADVILNKERPWSLVSHVDLLVSMASALVAQVYSRFPDARVHNVLELRQENNSHGVITFDTGEDTPIRQYVHLQVLGDKIVNDLFKGTEGLSLTPQVLQSLFEKFKPDSMMFKASMELSYHALRITEREYRPGELSEAVSIMADEIALRGGVIVDGDHPTALESGPDSKPHLVDQLSVTLKGQIERWGYEFPYLYRFKPAN